MRRSGAGRGCARRSGVLRRSKPALRAASICWRSLSSSSCRPSRRSTWRSSGGRVIGGYCLQTPVTQPLILTQPSCGHFSAASRCHGDPARRSAHSRPTRGDNCRRRIPRRLCCRGSRVPYGRNRRPGTVDIGYQARRKVSPQLLKVRIPQCRCNRQAHIRVRSSIRV